MKFFIYKIYKPDTEHLYIGSTNKISTRRSHHKKNTYNRVKKSYHRLLYKTIRDNGGWDAFIFEIVEELEVQDTKEGRQRELYWIDQLKPSLNMIAPCVYKAGQIVQTVSPRVYIVPLDDNTIDIV